MIVKRWQAPSVPNKDQIKAMFSQEGLEPFEEVSEPDTHIKNHRHPLDEIRMVASGEMWLDISGNQLLLRPGDKIIIPSNTIHSTKVGGTPCLCICAHKAY